MARVTLTGGELRPDGLPPVCVVCGEYAGETVRHRFGRSRLGLYFMACAPWACCVAYTGGLPVVIELVLNRRFSAADVLVPVCENHTDYWANRRLVSRACVAATWVNIGVVAVLSNTIRVPQIGDAMSIGMFVIWFVAFAALVVVDQTTVRAARITADRVTLEGVHPAFAAAVEDARMGEV